MKARHDGKYRAGVQARPAYGVMLWRMYVLSLVVAVALVLAGCGERPQVISYKQGTYQGKPDTLPYANATYNGNKQEWENALRTRAQHQNEYKRIH